MVDRREVHVSSTIRESQSGAEVPSFHKRRLILADIKWRSSLGRSAQVSSAARQHIKNSMNFLYV